MKFIGTLLSILVFAVFVFAVWWVFILPTPLSVSASQKMALQYASFTPFQLKAIHLDDLNDERLIPIYDAYAQKGNTIAQHELGLVYYHLPTPPQERNFSNAVKYFRQAAEAGWPAAQNALGAMLMQGEGVPRNRVEAYKWFSIASQAGHSKAQANLALVSSQMSLDQVYKAEELATQWIAAFIKKGA